MGFLPASLISTSTLKQTIADIDLALMQRYGSIHLPYHDPAYYYGSHNFLYFRSGSDLYITVKFPISTVSLDSLNVYSVTTFPVPFHNASSLLTILITPVHHFLISDRANYFAELSRQPPSLINSLSTQSVPNRSPPVCLLCFRMTHRTFAHCVIFRLSSPRPSCRIFMF